MREITKIEEIQLKNQPLRLRVENRYGSTWHLSSDTNRYCICCGHKGLWITDSDTYKGDFYECSKCGWGFWVDIQMKTDRNHPSAVALRAADRHRKSARQWDRNDAIDSFNKQ